MKATVQHCVSVNDGPYDCSAGMRAVHPTWDARRGVCRGIVHAVEYGVTHNGTRGVRAVDVRFFHRDVAASQPGRTVRVDRRFSVTFVRKTATPVTTVYERSGKPGYQAGKPVLVAIRVGRGGRSSPVDFERPKPMRLATPTGVHARCDPTAGRPVNFNENVDVRCSVVVHTTAVRKREESPTTAPTVGGLAEFCHRIHNEVKTPRNVRSSFLGAPVLFSV